MKKLTTILSLIFLIALSACNFPAIETGIPADYDPASFANIISSSLSKTNYVGNEYPICFEAAFTDSTFATEVTTKEITKFDFGTFNCGEIKITSGKLIAGDPIVLHDSKPFEQVFPIGQFPVQLAIAKIPDNNRVAYARIAFSKMPVSKWIYATKMGQKQLPLNDTTLYCFGVDGGMGAFIDSTANAALSAKAHSDWLQIVFNSSMYTSNYYGGIHHFDNSNMAIFSTGYGDGCYSTFIGLDSNNKVCRLLADFGFVWWWKDKAK